MLKLRQLGWVLRLAVPRVRSGRGARGGHQFAGLAQATERVDADVHDMALWPLLEKIASDAGWRIYVEPGVTHIVSAKFKNLPSIEALRMLFGDLNFRAGAADQCRAATLCFPHRKAKCHATGARAQGNSQARSQRIAREAQAGREH